MPITDMTSPYKGQDGGLYGGGRNEPPEAHRAAYQNESEKIRPLDENGQPSDNGKIGLISIGFSNTSIEWEDFRRTADADPHKSPRVVIVNGAIGGRSAVMWAWDGAEVLPKAEQDRLDEVMDVVALAQDQPPEQSRTRTRTPGRHWRNGSSGGSFGEAGASSMAQTRRSQPETARRVSRARPGTTSRHYRHPQHRPASLPQSASRVSFQPHLRRLVGRASGSPEPYAYESGFGTRWVMQSQIQGDVQLNYDPARGEVKAPLVIWGPYLWACGNTPRKVDGLTWTQKDVRADRLHPNEAGSKKTTTLLLNFFKTDAGTSRWFLRPGETGRVTPLPK